MPERLKSAIRSALPIRRFFKDRIIASLLLSSLTLSIPVRCLGSDTSPISLSQNNADVRPLEYNKPIQRELAGGESHYYQLALPSGQYAQVVVDQRGIDIGITASDPAGNKIVDVNMIGIGDAESTSFVAEATVNYRLEIRSPDVTAPRGSYEIIIKEWRAATEQDKSRVAAERVSSEAMQLYYQQSAESRRKALEKFQQSFDLRQAAKDDAGAAATLSMIGHIYNGLGERQKALEACNRGLSLARATGDTKTEAYLLDNMGSIYNELGDTTKALGLFEQALTLRRAASDRPGEVNTLNNTGMAYGWMGEPRKALDYFNRALSIVNELGDRRKEAGMLSNLCVIHSGMGEYKKALDFCNQSLAIKRNLKDPLGEATTLDIIGTIYSSTGEYQKALDFHTRSLAIYKDLSHVQGKAIVLNNIGWIYATLGEYEKAIDYYNQSLQLLRDLGDKRRIAITLNNIASNYADLKEYQKALDIHMQVLALRRDATDKEGEAITLNNMAHCYSHLGDREKALDYYGKAITLHRSADNPRQLATSLRNIGNVYKEAGEYQKAIDYFNEGLQISRKIGDRNNEAGILALFAGLERDRGNDAEARKLIEAAIATIESLRIGVKSHKLRAAFLASVLKYYEFDIDILMRLHKQHPSEGFEAAALEASEKGRARSLLELLGEARAEIRQGVDPALIEREGALQQMIADRADRQMRMLAAKHTEEQATAAANEINALTTEFEQLQAQIREKSPRYAALTQPAPLSLKEIQKRVLDYETLLLEYALGEVRSFLWAVTPTSIKSFELPKRAEIEQKARRVYELSTARNVNQPKETPEKRRQRIEQADAEYSAASMTLSQMLLGPVASELKSKRLLIVSDGVLQYVPFAMLPHPESRESRVESQESELGSRESRVKSRESGLQTPDSRLQTVLPLTVNHEVVSLPSASVVAVLRQETANRKLADRTLAVLADPVFSNDDPRVSSGKSRAVAAEVTSPTADAKRSASESGLGDLVRLRFSRQEADEIMRLATDKLKLKAVDFAANRELATSAEIGEYRIVHFAAHGLINNSHPELSGVVLSLVDEHGQPQNGFLRLYDVYNLKLNADLVVLSACQTALGKEVRGEGIVGLTRGFMYAGAPRVVASLWRIDDRATAELMRRFYSAMLGEGLRPAAALRAAQVSMWKDRRWQAPYYWAAFTLQGEWK